jgi:DNA-binding LacI/PurR family transcriptional regulator
MSRTLQVYYDGHFAYPPASDEPRWKFFEGVESSLAFNNMTVSWVRRHIDHPEFEQTVSSENTTGVLFLATHHVKKRDKLLSLDMPMVFTDISQALTTEEIAAKDNAFILVKNEEAATYELARLAHWFGHSRILFVKSPAPHDWENRREALFRASLESLDAEARIDSLDLSREVVQRYEGRMKALQAALKELRFGDILNRHGIRTAAEPRIEAAGIWPLVRQFMRDGFAGPIETAMREKCTLIVCSNDLLAECVHDYLRDRDIKIPRQISLAGFDNRTLGAFRLTSIDFGYQTGGTLAVSLLTEPDVRQRQNSSEIRLPCRLVDRGTVGQAL